MAADGLTKREFAGNRLDEFVVDGPSGIDTVPNVPPSAGPPFHTPHSITFSSDWMK